LAITVFTMALGNTQVEHVPWPGVDFGEGRGHGSMSDGVMAGGVRSHTKYLP
jgi:hypothetical protein